MQHAALKEGDTVLLRALVVSTAADFVGVQVGDSGYRQTFYPHRKSIVAVDDIPDADLIASLCGPMGRASSIPVNARG